MNHSSKFRPDVSPYFIVMCVVLLLRGPRIIIVYDLRPVSGVAVDVSAIGQIALDLGVEVPCLGARSRCP